MPDSTHRIFFSYARIDAAFVLRVGDALRKEGWPVWVDQLDIPKGARWDDEVEKALRASKCLLVVLSPASAQSQNVMDEVAFALDEKRPVLPILLHAGSIPFRLKRLQYIDFTGDFDAAYRELVAALGALLSPLAAPPPNDRIALPAREPTPAPAEAQRTEALAPGPPGPTARMAPTTAAAPKRRLTGIVVAVLAALVVGGAQLLGTHGRTPADTPLTREAPLPAGAERPATAPRGDRELVSPPLESTQPSAPPPSQAFSEATVTTFVRSYIAAQNKSSAAGLLPFYADKVDYFDQVGVGKEFILKDKQAYYRRWPEVENQLASAIGIDRSQGEGTALASYTIRYRVNNPTRAETRTGTARDTLSLRLINGEMLIVAQRQQVLGGAAN